MQQSNVSPLPLILSGPILRKTTSSEVVIWVVTSRCLRGEVLLCDESTGEEILRQNIGDFEQIQIGSNAWVTLLHIQKSLPVKVALSYDLLTPEGSLSVLVPSLMYGEETKPNFWISNEADYILHGSCRNPDHHSSDALVAADQKVSQKRINSRPDILMMSGDQIYADHVSGPLLNAIHQVILLLGLPSEKFTDSIVSDSEHLYHHSDSLYGRDNLLPHYPNPNGWINRKIQGESLAVFTSHDCDNHLMTFSEFFAMYLLVWSPELWPHIKLAKPDLTPELTIRWHEEKRRLDSFVAGLSNVRRLMAHIPTYMIFDDHDITDDWNLTIGWEQAVNNSSLATRIIGNGLISYWLCQGWGNDPSRFDPLFIEQAKTLFKVRSAQAQDELIHTIGKFEHWHYSIPTTPKVLVLDTRTRRWRSESNRNKPSGLMDWEALTEFQQELLNQEKVIVVSAAPIFGVKFIEALQRIMTWAGQPLLIDAENWMAHPGSANTLLSIFTHTKTPANFVILSGDVHYSFAYDIKLRHSKSSPNIFQITCSGFKNHFPEPLLKICDALDRYLYSVNSPLNLFTKRKRLVINKRDPNLKGSRRLVNQSAIGELQLDKQGKPKSINLLTADGELIEFIEK